MILGKIAFYTNSFEMPFLSTVFSIDVNNRVLFKRKNGIV